MWTDRAWPDFAHAPQAASSLPFLTNLLPPFTLHVLQPPTPGFVPVIHFFPTTETPVLPHLLIPTAFLVPSHKMPDAVAVFTTNIYRGNQYNKI